MPRTRVFFALFDGFEPLDLTGPSSVFQAANHEAQKTLYESIPITPSGGKVRSSSGFAIDSESSTNFRFRRSDLFLIVGAERTALFAAGKKPDYLAWLQEIATKCGRIGSICSGAYLLAKTGLADGHTISSHWDACDYLNENFPKVSTNADSIYTCDEHIWTSAGVTTGIDMALAILEEDHSVLLSSSVAKRLVVFARRQGNQSQFSTFLEAQSQAASREIRNVIDWMIDNAHKDINVATLASVANMTERTLYRKFEATMGIPPAKFLERLRLDMAKGLLEDGVVTKEVADRVGFRSYSGFRVAFIRAFGLSPSAHRKLHGRTA